VKQRLCVPNGRGTPFIWTSWYIGPSLTRRQWLVTLRRFACFMQPDTLTGSPYAACRRAVERCLFVMLADTWIPCELRVFYDTPVSKGPLRIAWRGYSKQHSSLQIRVLVPAPGLILDTQYTVSLSWGKTGRIGCRLDSSPRKSLVKPEMQTDVYAPAAEYVV
jgi:hypothetical protein